jgi:signal peptide peptidase SppA
MKLIDVLTSPWAIAPSKLQEIRAVYEAHTRGPKIDLKVFSLPSAPPAGYEVRGGVAVIPIEGVLTKGRSFFSILFGGSSMREIGDAFEAALADPEVKSIVLSIDSPGGTVDGTQELSQRISAGRGIKPIVAWADGMVASGAYWTAAAAEKIYISGDTVQVGSIGVAATHVDVSEQDKQFGERWTEITAGKYKRIASSHAPLSLEGKAYIQEQVDHIYSVFVESVADLRGRSVDQVLESADGRIFIGRQAVDVGLVDGVSTLAEVISQLMEDSNMDRTELKAKHPELYQSLIDEGRSAGIQEGVERGKKEGLDAAVAEAQAKERDRIKAIHELNSPGNEGIIVAAMFDGKSTAGDAALLICAADKKRREDMAQAISATAIKPVQAAEPAGPPVDETFEQKVEGLVKEGKRRGEAMAAVAREFPALHQDYLQRVNAKK